MSIGTGAAIALAAGAGASAIGAGMQASAAKGAAQTQQQSAMAALGLEQQLNAQQQQRLAPYQSVGLQAGQGLAGLVGLSPAPTSPSSPNVVGTPGAPVLSRYAGPASAFLGQGNLGPTRPTPQTLGAYAPVGVVPGGASGWPGAGTSGYSVPLARSQGPVGQVVGPGAQGGAPSLAGALPGGGGQGQTVTLQAPDGTTRTVPSALAPFYLQRGATVVGG